MRHYRDFNRDPVVLTTICDRCGRREVVNGFECSACMAAARAVWPNAQPINSWMVSGS